MTPYRDQLSIGDEPVVMYAGNVGFSQSLEMMVDAARAVPSATFVINGDGAARSALERAGARARERPLRRVSTRERLAEVLASADLHVVPLKAGLGNVSVPSKTYSILAAGRPVLAAIDAGTEVPRMIAASGAGRVVAARRHGGVHRVRAGDARRPGGSPADGRCGSRLGRGSRVAARSRAGVRRPRALAALTRRRRRPLIGEAPR